MTSNYTCVRAHSFKKIILKVDRENKMYLDKDETLHEGMKGALQYGTLN